MTLKERNAELERSRAKIENERYMLVWYVQAQLKGETSTVMFGSQSVTGERDGRYRFVFFSSPFAKRNGMEADCVVRIWTAENGESVDVYRVDDLEQSNSISVWARVNRHAIGKYRSRDKAA